MFYIRKNGELKDADICRDLQKAASMYENGEIVEVYNMLFDIVRDLEEFIRREEERG